MKQIKYIIAAAAYLLFVPALHAQLQPVMVDKTATQTGENAWTLTLKSYVTGVTSQTMEPADIIFSMDFSGSMLANVGKDNTYSEVTKAVTSATKAVKETSQSITATTKDKATAVNNLPTVATKAMKETDRTSPNTKNWTYNGVTANDAGTQDYSHFYRDENGDYYVMHKWQKLVNSSTGASNVYAIGYVDKNGRTWYLTSTGVSSTYEDITSATATLWNGTLYRGWTYKTNSSSCYGLDNGNADGTVAAQWYYKHTDGEYYPVRRANNLPDGNGNNNVYAAWVVINGTTYYLHGEKLDPNGYDTTIAGQYRSIWFGPLYKGGWTYATIKAATVSGGHYYKHTDGKYYAVQKAQETVDGVNTYQAFVEIPGVGKRYLFGTHLSVDPCPYSIADGIFFYFGDLYTGGWCSNNITDGTTGTSHYYLHTDGEYYPVRKETSTNNFQAYVDLPEGRRYFDGNGLSSNPYALSTTKYVTLYFGSLYTMTGWSYTGVTAATVGGGHYYKHTNDKYYPVLKEDLGADHAANRYQLYVEVPEGKRYLWGHQLHADPCPYSAATATVIWYGSLYKGGWSYSTITVNSGDNQGYSYKHTDGEYYPVLRDATIQINGVTTYQDYVVINNTRYYLCGSELSQNPYPYAVKTTVNNWFGPLYSGGWTYNNITPGNAASGYFYLHTDGEYYAVLKEDNGASAGSSRYQAYVNLPEGKRYLYGSHLSETPYPFSARGNVAIYYGTLYSGGWSYSTITKGTASGGHYYLHTDGQYYPVVKEDLGSGQSRYQAYVELPELGKMYLNGSSISSEPYPASAVTAASLYFGSLYKLTLYDYTKYEGLRRAVVSFIESMAEKSQATGVHHRIALAQFAFNGWGYTPKNAISNPHLKTITSASAGGYAALLADLLDINDPANAETLINTMNITPTIGNGHTRHEWGISIANGLFSREAGDASGFDYDNNGSIDTYEVPTLDAAQRADYEDRHKILIIIGDGEETDGAEATVTAQANLLKEKFADQNLSVFFVFVSKKAISNFVIGLSSGEEYCTKVEYYDENLIDALLGISESIGGAAIELSSEAIIQDVVKPEFKVPDNAVIQAFTANCIGGDENALVFEDEEYWEAFDLDGRLERRNNSDGTTTIRVTGFDFSANWCGDHGGEEGYKGKQIILQIPIIPQNGIVGGMLPTNTEDSQILDEEEKPVIVYPIPYVGPFPINIRIEKSGLLKGDSAVFLIWRKSRSAAAFDKTGAPYMRVVLTGEEGVEAVYAEIANLDPDFHYLIEESGWSWKYTPDPLSISTEDQSSNPFKFKNTLKDVTTKNGEAKAKNEFF